MNTSGYITLCGPMIPCLKAGQKDYVLSPQELSELMNRAFADGYQYAKEIYNTEITTSTWDAAKETEHGTN
jgi:hypothetical protein